MSTRNTNCLWVLIWGHHVDGSPGETSFCFAYPDEADPAEILIRQIRKMEEDFRRAHPRVSDTFTEGHEAQIREAFAGHDELGIPCGFRYGKGAIGLLPISRADFDALDETHAADHERMKRRFIRALGRATA